MCNNEKVIGIVMVYFGITKAAHCHPQQVRLTLNSDCRLILFVDFLVSSPYPKPYKQFAMRIVWLFCFSSVYESKLSTQPQNKKASQLC